MCLLDAGEQRREATLLKPDGEAPWRSQGRFHGAREHCAAGSIGGVVGLDDVELDLLLERCLREWALRMEITSAEGSTGAPLVRAEMHCP